MDNNFPKNSGKFPEDAKRANFKHYVEGSLYTPILRVFFSLKKSAHLTGEQLGITLLLWDWCYQNEDWQIRTTGEFPMGRSELAVIASCGVRQANDALQALVACSALSVVSRGRPKKTVYRWNVELLKTSSPMYLMDTFNVPQGTIAMSLEDSFNVPQRDNVLLVDLLIDLIKLNKQFAAHCQAVDNLDSAEGTESGDNMVGANAPSLPGDINERPQGSGRGSQALIASWAEAIRANGSATADEPSKFHLIHLILTGYQINFANVRKPTSYLWRLLQDVGLIVDLKQQSKLYFKDDDELSAYALKQSFFDHRNKSSQPAQGENHV